MFNNMKPLPKAIMIAAPIALAVWGYTTFAPKKVAEPVVTPVVVTAVPAESEAVTRAAAMVEAPVATAPQVQEAPAQSNVTSGDAGIAALLKAGKK